MATLLLLGNCPTILQPRDFAGGDVGAFNLKWLHDFISSKSLHVAVSPHAPPPPHCAAEWLSDHSYSVPALLIMIYKRIHTSFSPFMYTQADLDWKTAGLGGLTSLFGEC